MKKKMLIAMLVAAPICAIAVGFKTFSVSATGASTNSVVRSIQGELVGVSVTVPAGATGTVAIVNGDATYYTNAAMTASGMLIVRAPVSSVAGVAYTNTLDAIPINGNVTATVYQTSATTNTWTIKAIYR